MAIELRCQHCGKSMMLKDSFAGKRGRCPYCKGEIDVPQLAVQAVFNRTNEPPAFFAAAQVPPPQPATATPQFVPSGNVTPSEEIVYEDGSVKVTTARIMIGNTTYALRNITSVKMGITPPTVGAPIVIIIVSGIMTLVGLINLTTDFMSGIGISLIGAALLAVGIIWLRGLRPEYHLALASSSGEVQALTSTNRSYIETIVESVNAAIVRYR